MRAVRFERFGGPEVLQVAEVPDPHAGPGQVRIAVRAAGVNASDRLKRSGGMDPDLPQGLGYEAAGVVDEVGEGVTGTAVGDRVFGMSGAGAAQAELAVLDVWAPVPASLGFAEAAALPSAIETAERALGAVGVAAGEVVLVTGASGAVGFSAVQLAVARGARVIAVAREAAADRLRAAGAEPVASGDRLADRVRALVPGGVDAALDVSGGGVLPELVDLAGGPARVVTVADVAGAQATGVRFSRGDDGRALDVLRTIGPLIEAGRFTLPVAATFPLEDVAEAHRAAEAGLRGKVVLVVP